MRRFLTTRIILKILLAAAVIVFVLSVQSRINKIKVKTKADDIWRLRRETSKENSTSKESLAARTDEPTSVESYVDLFKKRSCEAIVSIGFDVFFNGPGERMDQAHLLDACYNLDNLTALANWFTNRSEFKQKLEQENDISDQNLIFTTKVEADENIVKESSSDWSSSFKPTNEERLTRNVTISIAVRLLKLNFTEELRNPGSERFITLSMQSINLLNDLLSEERGFLSIRILGFREGSVVALFDLLYSTPEEEERVFENVKQAIIRNTALKSESKFGEMRPQVDINFIKLVPQDVAMTLRTALQETQVSSQDSKEKEINESDATEKGNVFETFGSSGFETLPEGSGHDLDNTNENRSVIDMSVYVQLRVRNLEFVKNLSEPTSKLYLELDKNVTEITDGLFIHQPGFLLSRTIGFTKGSVLVNQELVFDSVVTNNTLDLVDRVFADSSEYFKHYKLLIDVNQTQVIAASQSDRCHFTTCPANSDCVSHQVGETKCVCRIGYVKVRPNRCMSICEVRKDFCKNGGICTLLPGKEPTCRCPTAYKWTLMNPQCEYVDNHDMVVLSAAAVLLCLGTILLSAVICYCCVINRGRKKWRAIEKRRKDDEMKRLCSRSPSQQWQFNTSYQANGFSEQEMQMRKPNVHFSPFDQRITLPSHEPGYGANVSGTTPNLQRSTSWPGVPRPSYVVEYPGSE